MQPIVRSSPPGPPLPRSVAATKLHSSLTANLANLALGYPGLQGRPPPGRQLASGLTVSAGSWVRHAVAGPRS
jgi:hypothetical protein